MLVFAQAVVAVGAIAVSIVVAVADAVPRPTGDTTALTQLAAIAGGANFAKDVVSTVVRNKVEVIIRSIESGELELGADVDKDEVVSLIKTRLAVHFPQI